MIHLSQSWWDVQGAEGRVPGVPQQGWAAGHAKGWDTVTISGILEGKANPCHVFLTNKVLYMAKQRLLECL